MGNVTSSINAGNLDSIANVVEQAKSNPSAILDSLNSRGRNVASALLNTIMDAKSDPSAAFDSLKAHGHNTASSLSDTAKGVGSNPLVAKLLHSFREYWHMAVALLPVSQKQILALVAAWWIPFTVTIVFLYLIGGFGKAGVRGSSLASRYQSRAYGGYTPRGGFFASSTSARMRGTTPLIYKAAGVAVASITVVAVYRSWVRK